MYDYAQTTYETCLACCLLAELSKNSRIHINKQLELACINHSMKLTREDFVLGHLDYLSKRFNASTRRIVENPIFYKYLKTLGKDRKIDLHCEKISTDLIDELLKERSVIVLIDNFIQAKITHCPHYITIIDKKKGGYDAYDPWKGKKISISKETLSKSISSLRNHLKMSPQLIMLKD